MPFYVYLCPRQHVFELFLPVKDHRGTWPCHDCRETATQVITAPMMVKVAQDVCYDSPIDGAPITSWAAREEDLKRHHCRPYDPEQKTDYMNRQKASDAALDRSIETYAEEMVAHMPTAQRGALYSELTEQGVDAQIERRTYGN